ncbi:MAG: hypothetical protein KDB44_04920 [Mycobacterium sp.]|nr:hypothetical protein [Mycobacterium sp.]
MNWIRKWKRPDRGWPKYLPGGRLRTSTVALVLAFVALSWLHQAYQPPTPAPAPETAVVPPGFVPDPQYTWVPRTNVRTREPDTTTTTTTTTPTETTTTSPGETTTSPGETTTPTSPTGPFGPTPSSPTTTEPGPDGSTPAGPQTSPGAATATTPAGPVAPATVPPR